MTSSLGTATRIATLAMAVRFVIVAWAWERFGPAGDGTFYHQLATRLAAGHGYTWAWPDGTVTAVAHYPVGYPALLALGYAVFGAHPGIGMLLNATIGGLGAGAVYLLTNGPTSLESANARQGERLAIATGVTTALHPALCAYTPALMTEGIVASVLCIAAAVLRVRPRDFRSWIGAGLLLGLAALVRPQVLVLVPVIGWTMTSGRRVYAACIVSAVAIVSMGPWVIRNCVRMQHCSVSENAGWNLLIGTQTDTGAWQPIEVPHVCREVWDEAAKDACFGREAKRAIVRDVAAWVMRIPAKLSVTFDYFGAAPWYLHESNPGAFSENAKTALGAIETLLTRAILLLAIIRSTMAARRRHVGWLALGLLACGFAVSRHAYLAYLLLVPWLVVARWPLARLSAAVIVSTAATHAVFFGAGRYGLLVVPFVTALAFAPWASAQET